MMTECWEYHGARTNGYGVASVNSRLVRTERAKTHCPAGHPYDEENTYHRPTGGRVCRTCARTNKRKRAA